MQRQLGQQLSVVLLRQLFGAAGAENRLMVTTVAADMDTHVFDDAEDRNVHLLKHHDAFFRIDQRDILRRRHHYRAGDRDILRKSQLNVAGAWRHIQHQIIQIRPQRLLQHLQQRLAGHRTAPYHGVIVGHQVADGVGGEAKFHDRRHMGAIWRGGTLIFRTEHGGNRRTINIGIEDPDFRPFRGQRQRQVHRRGGFTHPTFAGADGNNIFDPVDARLIFYPLQRGNVMRQLPVNRLRAGNAQQVGATLLF